MPTLSQKERDQLKKTIFTEELAVAIKDLKTGKSPGPDGLTSQYYKLHNTTNYENS